LFKEGFRKLLSQEGNYLEKQMIKNSVCQKLKTKNNSTRKTIDCFAEKQSIVSQKQSVVYISLQISKLNLKRLRREKERMHTDVYTGSL